LPFIRKAFFLRDFPFILTYHAIFDRILSMETKTPKQKSEKQQWIVAVAIFIIFTCILPFKFGASWVGGHKDAIGFRLFLWWFIRCAPSLIFFALFYAGTKNLLRALVELFMLLLGVSVLFLPVYWFVTLILAFS